MVSTSTSQPPAITSRLGRVLRLLLFAGFLLIGSLLLGVSPAQAEEGHAGRVNTAGSPLTVRTGPGTDYPKMGQQLADGTPVTVICQERGELVSGTYGTSPWWDKLNTGGYASDAYIHTGSDSRVAQECPHQRTLEEARAQADIGPVVPPPTPPAPALHPCNITNVSTREGVRALLIPGECALPSLDSDPNNTNLQAVWGAFTREAQTPGARWVRTRDNDDCSFVPERYWGDDFTIACRMHDFGYELARRGVLTGPDRFISVDQVLGEVMTEQCASSHSRPLSDVLSRSRCEIIANEIVGGLINKSSLLGSIEETGF